MHRSGGHHQQSEQGQQAQQRHRDPAGQRRRQWSGDHIAGHSPGRPDRCGSPAGNGGSGRQADQSGGGHDHRAQPDPDPVDRADLARASQHQQAQAEQDHRKHQPDPAQRARHHRVHAVTEGAGQSPPLPARHHQGQADQEQAHSVPAMRWIQFPGTVPDPPRRPTGQMGNAHPERLHHPERPGQPATGPGRRASLRPGARLTGAGPGRLGPGAGRAAPGPLRLAGLASGPRRRIRRCVPRRSAAPARSATRGRTGGHGARRYGIDVLRPGSTRRARFRYDQIRPSRGCASRGQAVPSTAAGPRLSSCLPMISRCTSLAPSQIRSTRSSRNIRSATFSRM